ncbi:MAG: polysaccharide biosynthesis protein [Planctomycetota bacterium]
MERERAHLDSPFTEQSILVTGGTGTIGSEIVRQLLARRPRVLRIFSRDETKQALLRLELGDTSRIRFLLGDVRDRRRLHCALEGIDTVFHAAALKHVPACEYNPFEAVQTNVVGTENLIHACRETGVKSLVYVSTDKAVNPANTMGATKLLAENLVRASQEWNPRMSLSVVRFGNVLGSRGSLIPMLLGQIEERREVELTSPQMTRFMMTIGDAVALVLEAVRASREGELFILKMPALRVAELIEVFVEEVACRRGWDPASIPIREVGVRPGEKIHEELVTEEESLRLEERERMYVVPPRAEARPVRASSRTAAAFPAACHSGRSELLTRQEIRALLERAHVLEALSPDAEAPLLRLEESLG